MNWKCLIGHYWALDDGRPARDFDLPDAPGYVRKGWPQHCITCGKSRVWWWYLSTPRRKEEV